MFRRYPYTNFHDINLDWIITKIKDLGYRVSDLEAEEGVVSDTNVIYLNTFNDVLNSTYPTGTLLITGGFYRINDKGSAIYLVGDRDLSVTTDNVLTYLDSADKVVYRIVDEEVNLESFNYKNTSLDELVRILVANNIKNINFDTITTSDTITLNGDDINLSFNKLVYEGTGSAIKCVDFRTSTIKGNTIEASEGTALTITNATRSSKSNSFNIRTINGLNGVHVEPTYSGIQWNDYNFGTIEASRVGLNLYVDDYDDRYVYIGEEHFVISNIRSENIGVNVEIKPYNNYSRGTITGVIFDQLATEYSNIGMRIKSGSLTNPDNVLAGIKTLIVNNWRTREYERTTTFLDAEGFLREVIINPNDPCRLSQWNITNTSPSYCSINAKFFNRSFSLVVAENLVAINNLKYFNKCTQSLMVVNDGATVDFSEIFNNDSSLYMAKYFQLGGSAKILLSTYYGDTVAEGVEVYIPSGATLTYRFAHSANDLTFTNSGANARFLIQNFKSSSQGTSGSQTKITNLGNASN